MKILAFCFFPAFIPVSNGGQSRLFNFYRALSKYHSITLLTSTYSGVEEEVIKHGINFIERRIPKDSFFAEQHSRLDKIGSGGDLSGPAIAASGKYPTLLHKAYLEEYDDCDVIFHDSPFTIDYDVFSGLCRKPRIYNSYNCESILYKQLHPAEKSKPIHELVSNSEKKLLSLVDIVLYCNDADLNAFHEAAEGKEIFSVFAPNGMSPVILSGAPIKEKKLLRAVFMGSGHPPNVKAAEFIVEKVAPKCPDVIFEFVGSCLSEGKYPENVIRHGLVGDKEKQAILARADLALNPMGEGSGSNVKVLEYFSYGIPVISTKFGMRGIHANPALEFIESDFSEFVSSINVAIKDIDSVRAIGIAGRKMAEENYSWQSIADKVHANLEMIFSSHKKKTSEKFILVLNDYDSFSGVGGGCTRTQGLYGAASQWCDVVFISYSDNNTLSVRRHSEKIVVINVPKTLEHQSDNNYINSQFHVSADDIVSGMHAHQNHWLLSVYAQLRKYARCIVVEHCYMARLPFMFGDRFVHSSQNNETLLKARILAFHPQARRLLEEVVTLERLAVEHSALSITVSQEDAESLVIGKKASGPVLVVPNGAGMPACGADVEALKMNILEELGKYPVVFLGSAHMPNIEAAHYIVETLAVELPEVNFHIVGSVCTSIKNLPRNVRLWGVADEITKSALLQSCMLALNPMISGSGSNVKQADYLGNGLYIVSTAFGHRGYPQSTNTHVCVVELQNFATEIRNVLSDDRRISEEEKSARMALFKRELSMQGLAAQFVKILQGLEKRRKKVLYVAYRYTAPAQGGAELNMEKFISALGHSDEYDVDVVAPEVSSIHNNMRFSERYTFDEKVSAPVNIPNVRFARFPCVKPDNSRHLKDLRKAWSAQVFFENELNTLLCDRYVGSGLTYGWAYPESDCARWAFNGFGIFLAQKAILEISGFAPTSTVVTAYNQGAIVAGPLELSGNFRFSLPAVIGEIDFTISNIQNQNDPRPLGCRISTIKIGGNTLAMEYPLFTEKYSKTLPGSESFYLLDKASEKSRTLLNINLTDTRGPWSTALEDFISSHVHEYDLVVAHNNVFRPAVIAMQEAKKHSVPSILIPHPHLDDDFYHFPDIIESARNATHVLAVPRAACEFYEAKGCNVSYMPAGCDAGEEFTREDKLAFEHLYDSDVPFVLVLGRKAGAKNYQQVIDAVDQLSTNGVQVKVVLIGPDDDGLLISSKNATYLGRQPRNIVRGALMSCVTLVNMSSSESFGIVLLEAWMAGKTVIANKNCIAFHDMAFDQENALLVVQNGVADAIRALLTQPELTTRLAQNGKNLVEQFSWEVVSSKFLNICGSIVDEALGDNCHIDMQQKVSK